MKIGQITLKDKSNISSNILPRLKAYLKQNFDQNKEYKFYQEFEIKLDKNQFYDFQTIVTLLSTTPEHIKIILNNYLNNIDKINMEGKSLQKKRRE